MQRPWRGASYWLAPHGLLSLLFYSTQDYQPMGGTTQRGLGSAHQSLIKKMPYKHAYSQVLWRHFLNGGSLLSVNSSLCQVDRKLATTLVMIESLAMTPKVMELVSPATPQTGSTLEPELC